MLINKERIKIECKSCMTTVSIALYKSNMYTVFISFV